MTTCERCAGSGLIGSGPEPWAHVGQNVTCDECQGVGQVGEIEPVPPVEQAPEILPTDFKPEPPTEEPEGKIGDDQPQSTSLYEREVNQSSIGDYSNGQVFEIGDKVEFYITNTADKYCGIHTITEVLADYPEAGSMCYRTDLSGQTAINAHWFRPVDKTVEEKPRGILSRIFGIAG